MRLRRGGWERRGSERDVWDDADQGLGWGAHIRDGKEAGTMERGRDDGEARAGREQGSKPSCGHSKFGAQGVGLLMGS